MWGARCLIGIRQEESGGRIEQREKSSCGGPDKARLVRIALLECSSHPISLCLQSSLPKEGNDFGVGGSAEESDSKGASDCRLFANCCSHRPFFEGRPGWTGMLTAHFAGRQTHTHSRVILGRADF